MTQSGFILSYQQRRGPSLACRLSAAGLYVWGILDILAAIGCGGFYSYLFLVIMPRGAAMIAAGPPTLPGATAPATYYATTATPPPVAVILMIVGSAILVILWGIILFVCGRKIALGSQTAAIVGAALLGLQFLFWLLCAFFMIIGMVSAMAFMSAGGGGRASWWRVLIGFFGVGGLLALLPTFGMAFVEWQLIKTIREPPPPTPSPTPAPPIPTH